MLLTQSVFRPGTVRFILRNTGERPHDLTIVMAGTLEVRP